MGIRGSQDALVGFGGVFWASGGIRRPEEHSGCHRGISGASGVSSKDLRRFIGVSRAFQSIPGGFRGV